MPDSETAAEHNMTPRNKLEDSRDIRIQRVQTQQSSYEKQSSDKSHSHEHDSSRVTHLSLYRYADIWDKLCLICAAITAIIAGAALPLMSIVVGNLSGNLADYLNQPEAADISGVLRHHVLYLIYLTIGEFTLIFISTALFVHTGERLSFRIRRAYLRAILRKGIEFYDLHGTGAINTCLTTDINLIQVAISEKTAISTNALSTFIAAFAIGFIRFWKLTAICMSSVLVIIVIMSISARYITRWNKLSLDKHAAGANISEEAFDSIRTVKALNAQDTFTSAYGGRLQDAARWEIRHQTMLGCMVGSITCVMFLNYALTFWTGGHFIVSGDTDKSAVVSIIMAIMSGIFAVGNIASNVQHLSAGVVAGSHVFGIIDSSTPLNTKPSTDCQVIKGDLVFQNITHCYPMRPTVRALDDVCLSIPAGKTTAIVGCSGSGKSSILSLIERFYDPQSGVILLDGSDIGTFDVHLLRRQIGLVEQQPVLFDKSIKENIADGLVDHFLTEKLKEERIIEAAKEANAHEFISHLPNGYDTVIGVRGGFLSGGQKQRIAIARAIVRNPKILLLDEATSALDTLSENSVRAALERVAMNRTTVIVAHRLSTVRNADKIIVLDRGTVVEEGTHESLLEAQGVYATLMARQKQHHLRDWTISENTRDNRISFDRSSNSTVDIRHKTETELGNLSREPSLEGLRTELSIPHATIWGNRLSTGKSTRWTLTRFLATFIQEDKGHMMIGFLSGIISGAAQPVQGFFFAQAVVAILQPFSKQREFEHRINFWARLNALVALVQLVAIPLQSYLSAICTGRLVSRIRISAFKRLMLQEIAFFDETENAAGTLSSFLSNNVSDITTFSGHTINTLISCLSTIAVAISISIAAGWKLALVCVGVVPVILATAYMRVKSIANFQKSGRTLYQDCAGFASEHLNAIRTVAAFTMETRTLEVYCRRLRIHIHNTMRPTVVNSTYYAASQSIIFLAIALGFGYGGTLLINGDYTLLQVYVVLTELIFSTRSAGTAFAFVGDIAKGKAAAEQIRDLFEKTAVTDEHGEIGQEIGRLAGQIEFRDVHFTYPGRPDTSVLKGLSMTIQAGQNIAVVGSSGSGKSTIFALLERFYKPLLGGIFVDGRDIASFKLNDLRNHIAVVSQEPLMYEGTIRDNLLLGFDLGDNLSADLEDQMIQACKGANIYDFICSLPDGFFTQVGSKSKLLSGGQKQRLTIARALLRNPKILLLDEATSALDSQSQDLVRQALKKTSRGRTTISIAQRLSTVKDADCIFVIEAGVVVERGSHSQLMNIRNGHYQNLVTSGCFNGNREDQSGRTEPWL
ncbi:uncharacterized protein A1O9_08566 [Exophiala aquamarina CBS 119918]|uniref:ATP-binding cassette, subfamily B (MDR/TAP), member 1 n=1 Tax=Exophiala aquamarina CBS 119918 TaxID=1182545 RepID=A0A072PK01_9EURO|nr:uncharacterized protein A1O9_08566 [Exophiala aquamarina CBS 119918]KEF55815.1 hypothetical protein A1O9_08566 [Exophiala aquamarina CBS 119918]